MRTKNGNNGTVKCSRQPLSMDEAVHGYAEQGCTRLRLSRSYGGSRRLQGGNKQELCTNKHVLNQTARQEATTVADAARAALRRERPPLLGKARLGGEADFGGRPHADWPLGQAAILPSCLEDSRAPPKAYMSSKFYAHAASFSIELLSPTRTAQTNLSSSLLSHTRHQ